MIPVKLILEGLYSYQKRQTIDFGTLTQDHLFGIFGTVGSGKSSILEAITFALYGKTERLMLSGDNRNYNMMNLKSNQLYIEFDFKIGLKEEQYKVTAQSKRNGNNYEDVRQIKRTIYKWSDDKNEYIPITNEELEEAIGLSYDNFKRTIIIPQGRFQDFLQLKNTDRTRMMKELFSLDKFDLFYKVRNLESKNNNELTHITGRIEQIGEISKEEINKLTAEIKILNDSLLKIQKESLQLEKELTKYNKLKETNDLLQSQMQVFSKLSEKKTIIAQQEKEMHEYEYCLIHFKSHLENLAGNQRRLIQFEKLVTDDKKLQETNQSKLKTANQKYIDIKQQYDKIDLIKKEVEDLKKIKEILLLKEKLEENKERLKKGAVFVDQTINSISELEAKEQHSQNKTTELKKELPDLEELTNAQKWHQMHLHLTKTKKEHEKEDLNIQDQISQLVDSTSQKAVHPKLLDLKDLAKWEESIQLEMNKQNEMLTQLTSKTEELLVNAKLAGYADSLKEGDPCPLCGSVHHPQPFNQSALTSDIEKLQRQKDTVVKSTKQLEADLSLLHQFKAGYSPLKKQLTSTQEKINKTKNELLQLQPSFNAKYKTPEETELGIKKSKKLQEDLKLEETELAKIKKSLHQAVQNKEKYTQALHTIEKDIAVNEDNISVLTKQVDPTLYAQYINKKEINFASLIDEKEQHIKEVIKLHDALKTDIEKLNKSLDEINGRLGANAKILADTLTDIKSNEKELNQKIQDSSFDDFTSINAVLDRKLDTENIRKQINSFHQEYKNTEERIKEYQNILQDKIYDRNKHIQLQQRAAELNQQLSTCNQQLGEQQSKLKHMESQLKLQEELIGKRNELQNRAQDITTLRKLFTSSGFVNYISSVYLQQLCHNANARFFKMTGQKLSLELTEDNTFIVRDFLNGGKTRSIKTLSGGQTFQASLALALALSDNIQSMTKTKQNFFFLDEGFGSLDKEALHVVFTTLKDLKKENRIVGIISHVEELQQEIPTYLKVTQDSETGSSIKESWA